MAYKFGDQRMFQRCFIAPTAWTFYASLHVVYISLQRLLSTWKNMHNLCACPNSIGKAPTSQLDNVFGLCATLVVSNCQVKKLIVAHV